MIISFANKQAKKIFENQISSRFSPDLQYIAKRKLNIIDAAHNLNDLRLPPANHLKKLKGNYKDKYSIRINDQYRIIFNWKNNNAYNLEIIDYH